MPGSLAPDRPRGAWSINHHHSRTRPRWLPPARRRPRGGRRRQPAGWPPIRACVPATVRGVPTPPRRPAGQLGRPVGRCTLRACACACGARSHVVHAPRARTDAIAGRSHVRIAFRSLSPLPPPPYYLTHAGKHGARDLLYYQESDLVPARQFTTPAAFMLVGTRN